MEKGILYVSCIILAASVFRLSAAQAYYGKELCTYQQFSCPKVKKGDTWEKRWPDPRQRDIVMRLNRTNLPLSGRSWVLVPKDLTNLDILDLSPFPAQMNTSNRKLVLVDLSKLAFAAYDQNGQLLRWGPVSGGKDFCKDIQESCTTPPGMYQVTVKGMPTAFPQHSRLIPKAAPLCPIVCSFTKAMPCMARRRFPATTPAMAVSVYTSKMPNG